ncbi:hemerythrin domain-containing protein [Andreprevotia chitinilytica]|uniref:hemerythrin domain-containing protein n=1 Tax=Andreprevotia chitinilytica TaxID=396808 RepID=UPI00068A3A16|nr:hemerythrin domain-containing protein [Andreprevotia chitinilytica]
MDMSSFYQEHADLAVIVTRLKGHIAKPITGSGELAAVIAGDLTQLSTKLNLHLGKEDLYLYPRLLKSAGPEKALAEAFQKEMGGLKEAYGAFKTRWGNAQSIAAEPDVFIRDAKAVIQALETRIKRENTELYKAAEKI